MIKKSNSFNYIWQDPNFKFIVGNICHNLQITNSIRIKYKINNKIKIFERFNSNKEV